ncbi:MAG: dihydrodipicolinate synthase, partial [Elusimicrobia bacterium]
EAVVRVCVEEAQGRVPVIAGVSGNDTARAAQAAARAESWGADALLVLAPYYNKPGQEGLYRHFKAVSAAIRLPVVVYNIPGRTGVNVEPGTLARLAEDCRNVVGVKEASGSVDQAGETLLSAPKGFSVLSGDDSLTLPMMALGASGVVSVASNLFPGPMARLCRLASSGDFSGARKIHRALSPLMKALFLETNPIPVKAAASALGLCEDELRLPLTRLSGGNRKRLLAELRRARRSVLL